MKKELSKVLSLILRHQPEEHGILVEENGWVLINDLVSYVQQKVPGFEDLVASDVENLVFEASKKRHEIENGKIRALTGHSINVDIAYSAEKPPSQLFHATSSKYVEKIKSEGLKKMSRNYVHLSNNQSVAVYVAQNKYNKIQVFQIEATTAFNDGIIFYNAADGFTWLCEYLPPKYLSILFK